MEAKEEPTPDILMRGFTTRAVHAGLDPNPELGAIIPPIYVSTTYEISPDQPLPVSLLCQVA